MRSRPASSHPWREGKSLFAFLSPLFYPFPSLLLPPPPPPPPLPPPRLVTPSGLTSIPAGLETPEMIQLRSVQCTVHTAIDYMYIVHVYILYIHRHMYMYMCILSRFCVGNVLLW